MGSFKPAKRLITPIERYLAYLQSERGINVSSLLNYRSDLLLFCDFIGDYRLNNWSDIRPMQAQAFLNELPYHPLSHATIKRRHSSLHGFFNYLRQQSLLVIDPLAGFKWAVSERATAAGIIEFDRRVLLDYSADDFLARRDKAILAILLSCEMTLPVLLRLEVFSVDIANKQLNLTVRGTSPVSFDLTQSTTDILGEWFSERVAVVTFEQALFISRRGRRLSLRGVQLAISRVGRMRGIAALTATALQHNLRRDKPETVQERELTANTGSDTSRIGQLRTTYQQLAVRVKKHD